MRICSTRRMEIWPSTCLICCWCWGEDLAPDSARSPCGRWLWLTPNSPKQPTLQTFPLYEKQCYIITSSLLNLCLKSLLTFCKENNLKYFCITVFFCCEFLWCKMIYFIFSFCWNKWSENVKPLTSPNILDSVVRTLLPGHFGWICTESLKHFSFPHGKKNSAIIFFTFYFYFFKNILKNDHRK